MRLGIEQRRAGEHEAVHPRAVYRYFKWGRAGADSRPMAELGADIESDLQQLDAKLKQLRVEYEQYFLGGRKREPSLLRGDVNKMVGFYANVPIRNTALRFQFNNLRARFFTLKRHWDDTCRKIEDGTYERHLFKAELHERERGIKGKPSAKGKPAEAAPQADSGDALFRAYREAREATGQDASALTREKFDGLVRQQEEAIRAKFGAAEVRFRVAVENGKAKLKATPVKAT